MLDFDYQNRESGSSRTLIHQVNVQPEKQLIVCIYGKAYTMKKAISEEHQKRLDLIASYLRELRFSETLTQKEISSELNLHLNTIIRLENGHNMTLLSLFELCDFYGVTLSEILGEQI